MYNVIVYIWNEFLNLWPHQSLCTYESHLQMLRIWSSDANKWSSVRHFATKYICTHELDLQCQSKLTHYILWIIDCFLFTLNPLMISFIKLNWMHMHSLILHHTTSHHLSSVSGAVREVSKVVKLLNSF